MQVNRIITELPILYFKESKVVFSKIMMHFFHEFLFFNFANSMDPGPEVIKLIPCSTQLSTKFILPIKVKMLTIVGILTFISMINTTSMRLGAKQLLYFSVF